MYGEGISKVGEILDLGVKAGLVEKSGAWFSYDSQRIGQGRENATTFLKENRELLDRLEQAIRANPAGVSEALMGAPERDGEEGDGRAWGRGRGWQALESWGGA